MQFSSLSTKPKTKMTKRNCVLLFGCYVQNQKCSRLTCRPRSNMKDESVRKPSRKWIFIPCHKKYSQTTTVWSSSQKPILFCSGNLGYFSFWQWHFGTCTISQSHRKSPFSCQVLSQKTRSGFVYAVSNSLFLGSSIELCLRISLPSKQELLVNIEPFII